MHSRKAQLTVFILLGLVLLGVAVLVGRQRMALAPEEQFPTDLQPAKEYLEYCMQQSLDTATREVALLGGYAEMPELSVEYEFLLLDDTLAFPYYYYQGEGYVPQRSTVAANIARSMGIHLSGCLSNASAIKGYTFRTDAPVVAVTINDGSVEGALRSGITVIGEQSRYSVRTLKAALAFPLGEMLSTAAQLTALQAQDPANWCITCVSDLASPAVGIEPTFLGGEGETIITYAVVQRDAQRPLQLRFAHRLSPRDIPPELALPEIATLTAKVGEPFTYALPKQEREVLYVDDSSLFDIDPFTGTISFTPSAEDAGKSITTITMRAPSGDFTQETFTLEVAA